MGFLAVVSSTASLFVLFFSNLSTFNCINPHRWLLSPSDGRSKIFSNLSPLLYFLIPAQWISGSWLQNQRNRGRRPVPAAVRDNGGLPATLVASIDKRNPSYHLKSTPRMATADSELCRRTLCIRQQRIPRPDDAHLKR
ncbi:hypothetical protein ACFX1R_018895 [Malus domestica]